MLAAIIFAAVTPLIVQDIFKTSAALQEEAIHAFLWLAASVPPLLLTSCLRNILEARQRFDLTNILKIPASLINYLVPLLSLSMTKDISVMLAFIFLGRLVILLGHVFFSRNVIPELKCRPRVGGRHLRKLIDFGLWATLSSLINPVILVADRFLVASLFGLAAVTYYITPYEVVTKLWVISASLMGALFPLMSAISPRSEEMTRLHRTAYVILVGVTLPMVSVILVFCRDILEIWIGANIAQQSGSVAKWIALGIFFNILGQIPLTLLQASGRPDSVAKIQLFQLPIFLALAWYLSRWQGTVGVAMAWALRVTVEALALQLINAKWMETSGKPRFRNLARFGIIVSFLFVSWGLESFGREQIAVRSWGFCILLGSFAVWYWTSLLHSDERATVMRKLHTLLKTK